MKKMTCYAFTAALALSLCACANSNGTISGGETESDTPFVEVSDPFSENNSAETESGGTDTEEDDGFNYLREMNPELFTEDYIDFMKHMGNSFRDNNVQVKANGENYGEDGPVTYRGGEVEISFTATTEWVYDDCSKGYRVFIGGTPQIISLNGSEPSTMVILEGKKGDTKECSIRFTPRLTKENIADKDNLTLTLYKITHPLFLPYGTVEDFDPPHEG